MDIDVIDVVRVGRIVREILAETGTFDVISSVHCGPIQKSGSNAFQLSYVHFNLVVVVRCSNIQ